jgi:asparagine synthase (glutamine-hydrolysing)
LKSVFGVFHLDGRRANNETFTRWIAALPQPSGGIAESWDDGPLRLGGFSCKPAQHRGPHVVFGRVRLDNREELLRLLDLPAELDDLTLIAYAFDKWGLDLGAHLLGDWAFALWDKREQRLVLGHDFLGTAGLYYYRSPRILIFASSLPELLAHPDVPKRLNPVAIAQLTLGGKRDTSTFYQDVFSLRPAHVAVVTNRGMEHRRHWCPTQISPIRFSRGGEYVEAFLEKYGEAVRCRVRGGDPVGVLLSSGLDSLSVAALASRELARDGKRLTSLTWVPGREVTSRDDRCFDESARVMQIRDHLGTVDSHFIPASIGPLAGFRRVLQMLGQPGYIGSSGYWQIPLFEAAQRHGVRTLLTGDWGNFTISWGGVPTTPADRVRAFSRRLRDRLSRLWHGGERRPSRLSRAVVRSERARRVLEEITPVDADLEALRRRSPQPLQSVYNLLQSGQVAVPKGMAAAVGLDLRIPPLDKRIVEFCLAIPNHCYRRGGGDRLLIRDAMKGLLPEESLWPFPRGRVQGDMAAWVETEAEDIADVMHRLERSPLAREWLNVPAMIQGLAAIRASTSPDAMHAFDATYRGLGIGLFLLEMDG